MPAAGFTPMGLQKFGGLNTFVNPTNLQTYSSPDCSDVEFVEGLVRTRPGLVSQFSPIVGNPTVNYLKTYITPTTAIRMLALDSLANFYKEVPQGILNVVAQIENTGVYGNSVSLFDREYLGFGDGMFGRSIPRQFDDTNFDRVSQIGPAAGPSVINENVSVTITSVGLNPFAGFTIGTISQSGYIVTVTASSGGGITTAINVGDVVVISGVSTAGYNGTWAVSAILANNIFQYVNNVNGLATVTASGNIAFGVVLALTATAITLSNGQLVNIVGATNAAYDLQYVVRGTASGTSFFLYNPDTIGFASSGNGSLQLGGSVVEGTHQCCVIFQTRQGYLTAPSPPSSWVATGNLRAFVTNIPIGPPNVTGRILIFTAVNADSFFFIGSGGPLFSSNMIIPDNTTTTIAVDFSDELLLEGTNVDELFDLVELGECTQVTQYSSRLFWCGERSKIYNMENLTFDGGWNLGSAVGGGDVPLGWVGDASGAAAGGGTKAPANTPVWGDAYRIVGDGANAVRGRIAVTAYQDYLGDPIISPNTGYSVRVRLINQQTSANFTQGNVQIQLFSTIASIATGLTVPASTLTHSYQEFIGVLTTGLATIPTDLTLRVYMDGTPNLNAAVIIDNIEVFQTNQPYNVTIVRSSRAPDIDALVGPESYDGTDGFLDVAPANGQAVKCTFVIRNNLYLVKQRSMYVTQDDQTSEPANWEIDEVSTKIGTLSPRGVALGDEWAIIAAQDGVYYFDGSQPQKISQEIQPTWDSINWAYGYLVNVTVDIKRKRVYILAPFGAATFPNQMLVLDYADGFGNPDPTTTVNIAGIGRKWTFWNIPGNSMNLILRADGTQPLFVGNNTATGKIYGLDATGTVFSDDGVAINSYWQSGYFQDTGRMDFGYILANVTGVGTCGLILRKGDQGWISNLRGWALSNLGFHDLERNIGSIVTERLSVRIGTNLAGNYFSLQGLSMWAKRAAYAPFRGINA